MTRTVLFDLGRVLLDFSHERMRGQLAALARRAPEQVAEFLASADRADRFERGHLKAEELRAAFLDWSGIDVPAADLARAAGDIFQPVPGMAEIVHALKRRGVRLVLLSNTNPFHFEFACGQFPELLGAFDRLLVSHEVGAVKPEDAIYHAALAAIDCRPAECFYTDDIPEYVAAGRRHGLMAEVFSGRWRLSTAFGRAWDRMVTLAALVSATAVVAMILLRRRVPARVLVATRSRPPADRRLTMAAAACLLVAAVISTGPERWIPHRPRPLWIVVDVSRSMMAEDAPGTRLAQAKRLAMAAADQPGLVGLVAFAGDARIVAPLSEEKGFLRQAIRELDVRSAPLGGSRPDRAFRRIEQSSSEPSVILLFSDGGGADEAASEYPVIAVGIGGPNAVAVPGVVRAMTRLEEAGLIDLARRSGGVYLPPGAPMLDLNAWRTVPDPAASGRPPWFIWAALAAFCHPWAIRPSRRWGFAAAGLAIGCAPAIDVPEAAIRRRDWPTAARLLAPLAVEPGRRGAWAKFARATALAHMADQLDDRGDTAHRLRLEAIATLRSLLAEADVFPDRATAAGQLVIVKRGLDRLSSLRWRAGTGPTTESDEAPPEVELADRKPSDQAAQGEGRQDGDRHGTPSGVSETDPGPMTRAAAKRLLDRLRDRRAPEPPPPRRPAERRPSDDI